MRRTCRSWVPVPYSAEYGWIKRLRCVRDLYHSGPHRSDDFEWDLPEKKPQRIEVSSAS